MTTGEIDTLLHEFPQFRVIRRKVLHGCSRSVLLRKWEKFLIEPIAQLSRGMGLFGWDNHTRSIESGSRSRDGLFELIEAMRLRSYHQNHTRRRLANSPFL